MQRVPSSNVPGNRSTKMPMRVLFPLVLWLLLPTTSTLAQTVESGSPRQRNAQPLALAEAINRAREQHPLIIAAHQRNALAEGERFDAGRRLNPSLSVSGENFPAGPTERGFEFSRSLDWFATFSQTFETARKRELRLAVAERGIDYAQAEASAIERQVVYEVKAAYQLAAVARERVGLARENLDHVRQLVGLNEVRVKEGYTSEADLIKTRLEAQRVEFAARKAALDYERARIGLLRAMGESDFEVELELAGRLEFEPVAVNIATLQEAALRQPLAQAAEARLARAQAALQLERARAKPDLTFTIGYKRNGPDNALFGAVSVPLPVFNRHQGPIARAEAEARVAEAELRLVRNQILAELAAARRAVGINQQQVEAMQADFLKRADQSQSISLIAYREGAADLLVLLEAQRARGQAQELYFQAVYDYRLAVHELERVAGIERLPARQPTSPQAQKATTER
jgi:cobalt-zinc-cadmium efflux system outer membrane protein